MSNALVALGGGPSPVINASLLGVIERAMAYPGSITRVLGALHGIEGVLTEQLIDLSAENPAELARLRHTPASGGIGTCRYKLKPEQEADYDRIVEVLRAHDVGYFFYIGGNDSMDTADRVSKLAARQGFPLTVTGVPKTIDNDVGDPEFRLIDHTPGYGSAARYWASVIQNAEEENRGMAPSEPVSVWQAMGRKSGFIAAAARLADPERAFPLQLYLAESGLSLPELAENVDAMLRARGRCIVVVGEGFDVGTLGEARDGFGHVEYGASQTTAAQVVVNYLNSRKLPVRGQATGQVPGVLQRGTAIYRSAVDVEEAYAVGAHAVEVALKDGTGFMATILRAPGDVYRAVYDKVPLALVAASERSIPAQWLAPSRIDVTDDFVRYARPLIGDAWPEIPLENGLQRFARLTLTELPRKLNDFTPQGY